MLLSAVHHEREHSFCSSSSKCSGWGSSEMYQVCTTCVVELAACVRSRNQATRAVLSAAYRTARTGRIIGRCVTLQLKQCPLQLATTRVKYCRTFAAASNCTHEALCTVHVNPRMNSKDCMTGTLRVFCTGITTVIRALCTLANKSRLLCWRCHDVRAPNSPGAEETESR